jgi:hypothetical protein
LAASPAENRASEIYEAKLKVSLAVLSEWTGSRADALRANGHSRAGEDVLAEIRHASIYAILVFWAGLSNVVYAIMY